MTGQSVFLGQEEKKMINELIKLAVHLDSEGYYREANYVDEMMKQSRIELTHEYGRRHGKLLGHKRSCGGEGGLLSYYGLEHLDQMTKKVILNKIKKYKPGSSKGDKIVSLMESIEAKNTDRKWALDPQLDYFKYYDVFKSLMLSIPLYAYNNPEGDSYASYRGPPWDSKDENKRENRKPPKGAWRGECIGIYYNAGGGDWTNPGDYMPTIEHEVEHAITGAMYATYGFNRITSQKGKLRRLLPDPPGDIEMEEVSTGTKRVVHDEQLAEMHVELMGLSKFLVENNLGTSSEPFNSKVVEALCPTIPYDASDPMMLKILLGLYGGHIDEFGSWQKPTGDDPEGFFEDDSWGRDIQARLENAACNNDLNQMLEDFNALALAPAAEQVNTPEEVGTVYSSGVVSGLIKLSTHLDSLGYHREADYIDSVIKKMSTEIEEPEQLGEVINLDEFRRSRNKSDKPPRREKQDPKVLMENWQALQDAIDDVQNTSERYPESTSGSYPVTQDRPGDVDERRRKLDDIFLVVFDDGETYSGDASIVKVSPEDLERINEGEKVYNVIPPDHETLKSKWKDIWDVIKTDDLY